MSTLILSNEHSITTSNSTNNHVLVISPSGGGKTVSFLEPNLLHNTEDNLIIRVSKRAFVDKYKPYLALKGYRVYDLNLSHPEEVNKDSVSYDPMASAKDETSVHRFAEQIVQLDDTSGTTAEPYWGSAATELLKSLLFLEMYQDNKASFADVHNRFSDLVIYDVNSDGSIKTSLDAWFKLIEKKDPHHEAVRTFRMFSSLPYRTAACVYSTLASVMRYFSKQFIESIENLPAFNVVDFYKQKSVLFITANATDSSRFKLSNMFFDNLIHDIIEEGEVNGGILKYKTRLIIDDFGVGGVIKSLPAALSFVRESGLSIDMMCQSLSMLNSAYGSAKATTIKNNVDTTLYIGAPNDLETAKEMGMRINRPIMDMLSLSHDQIMICRRGQVPILERRYQTLEDPKYIALTNSYAKLLHKAPKVERKQRKDFSLTRSAV